MSVTVLMVVFDRLTVAAARRCPPNPGLKVAVTSSVGLPWWNQR
jgi:hypothetical protein